MAPTQRSFDGDLRLLAAVTSAVSLLSLVYYFQRGEILLYGDAVAHINIARRVFDSQTPGLLQLGTVWLPLPHLLMMPFLISDWMWRTGLGGSIPSMIAKTTTRRLPTTPEFAQAVNGSSSVGPAPGNVTMAR